MILVDTSVWIDHLRRGNPRLVTLLDDGAVLCHPFVVGELACGNLRKRTEILGLLAELPSVTVAGHKEVLRLVNERHLHGRGLGWIDVHLLAAALLTHCALLTLDKPLETQARRLGVARA